MKKRYAALFLSVILLTSILTALFTPLCAFSEERKTVRVGWHEPPYFVMDQHGRRTGYSYEYLRKVSSYTGWKYEYVEGSFSELLQMLMNGEIDLMSNISFTQERQEKMLYTSLPMGTESYYIFVSPDNSVITSDNYNESLKGKKIGVTRGSFQSTLLSSWLQAHGIEAEVVELTTTEDKSILMLDNGIDAFATVDVYGDPSRAVPISKIGSSEFFFAVSRNRPDLLLELDNALNLLQDEDKFYNLLLNEQFLNTSETNFYLSPKEREWLVNHGAVRVGYQDRYLAFCASDPVTRKLTGALKDYLEYASTALENAHIDFTATAYPTAASALEALQKGEIDCMFPANLSTYDGESMGLIISPALMRTEMDAVVRASDQKEFILKKDVTVAVNEGNTNYDLFLEDHYPKWRRAYFQDTPAGLDAVAAGTVDCVIISNYRFNNISKQCEKLHLTTVNTGVEMEYSFAIREGETELYSILTRLNNVIPEAVINKSLMYYSTEDVKMNFVDYIKDNLFLVMAAIALILLIILILLLRSIRAERKAREEERQILDLNKRVFVDPLTSVRNKGAFDDYLEDLQTKLEGHEPPAFAIGIFDCDNLKKINDHYGHDKGNEYLKASSRLICKVFQHSPVFRVGGDEFAVVLQNHDFDHLNDLIIEFEMTEKEICTKATQEWDEVHVAMGFATYDPNKDDSVNDTVRRADRIMYENKRKGKK